VHIIFRSYLKLGSLNLLMADLHKQGIVTKVRTLKTGETVGGILVHPRAARPPPAQSLLYRCFRETEFSGQRQRGRNGHRGSRAAEPAPRSKMTLAV
jgi:hypothetical protein